MTFVYVAGYGRSGSTFLDRVLGWHDGVFSAGELTHLFNYATAGRLCRCGNTVADCPVWSRVLEDVPIDLEQAHALTRKCEDGVHGLWATKGDRQEYSRLWRGVLSSLYREVGGHVIVDASKTTVFTARRPWLIKGCVEDIRFVHLTRDPRASIWSVRKGGNIVAANRRRKSLSTWRTAGSWLVANVIADCAGRRGERANIRYEDLVSDPVTTLGRIGTLVDLNFDMVSKVLGTGGHLPMGHGISGNRMRRFDAGLTPDTDWTTSAPREVRMAGACTAPVAWRYGYYGWSFQSLRRGSVRSTSL